MPVDVMKAVSDDYLEYAMILDSKYIQIDILDTFESFYWVERYNETGNFELVMPVIEKHLPYIRIHNYLAIKESKTLMVIEDVTLKTDEETGDSLVISGRTLDSILDRRIVWGSFTMNGQVQSIIQTLLNQNAIVPSNQNRSLPGLIFSWSGDPELAKITEEVEYFGDNLYSTISSLCSAHNIGIRAVSIGEGFFMIQLYLGVDRSWSQKDRPPVVFSHSYENLLESDYLQTEVNYASNALVRGDDDEVTMEVARLTPRTGLARREIFIDTNLQPETQEVTNREPIVDDNGDPVYDSEGNPTYNESTETIKIYDQAYYNRMLAMAKVEMAKHSVTEAFSSEVDTTHQFFYETDYNIGDIVQVENRYGFEGRCRIIEVMRYRDANGPKLIPSFIMVDEGGNEVVRN